METRIKFIKKSFWLIPVDLDLWVSIKFQLLKKNKQFSSTFQTLSNQESLGLVKKKKKSGVNCNLLYKKVKGISP